MLGAVMDALDHLRNHLFDIWQGQSAMDGITCQMRFGNSTHHQMI